MISEEPSIDSGEENPSYFIDLNWYEETGHSLPFLARARLCPAHQKSLATEDNPDAFLKVIGNCCSSIEGFFNARLTVKELLFRLFLSNGNQPLELDEIAERLGEWKGGLSRQSLCLLLDNDSFYGLRRIPISTSPQIEESPPDPETNPPPPPLPSPQVDLT
jgi:hypothetical protein